MTTPTPTIPVSIVIPTYQREEILLETIEYLLALEMPAQEIIVIDQTDEHKLVVEEQLLDLNKQAKIKWHRLTNPSIPGAMNVGLCKAQNSIVVFLDDDIIPDSKLIYHHYQCYQQQEIAVVAGRVVQPWEDADKAINMSKQLKNVKDHDALSFNARGKEEVKRFIGCNFSVDKRKAILVGGFDEQFSKVAYRFEAEFADRIIQENGRIMFEPAACVIHLHTKNGGTRSYGDAFLTFKPNHSLGRYYYLLRAKSVKHRLLKILCLPFQSVMTRTNLYSPWRIVPSFIAETAGLLWALFKYIQGPKLMNVDSRQFK